MHKFILVHDATNNASPMVINVSIFNYAEEDYNYTGATHIHTDYGSFRVTETREQIFEMLNK